jgi:hypothetical protein
MYIVNPSPLQTSPRKGMAETPQVQKIATLAGK